MNLVETNLADVRIFEPRTFRDARGYFRESWNRERYESLGIHLQIAQDNHSFSKRGVLRGLHFQQPNGQSKLVTVLSGEVFDVFVDVRVGSPSFGQWVGATLSGENGLQVFAPAGFAHGFVVTGDHAVVSYKTDDYYNPAAERTLMWNDPAVGISWPIADPAMAAKDADALSLDALRVGGHLPQFTER